MKSVFAVAALAAYSQAVTLQSGVSAQEHEAFLEYCAKWGKTYQNAEEFAMRESLFAGVHQWLAEANNVEGDTAQYAHNKFSDWTEDEVQKLMGFKQEIKDAMGYESDGGDADDEGDDSDDDSAALAQSKQAAVTYAEQAAVTYAEQAAVTYAQTDSQAAQPDFMIYWTNDKKDVCIGVKDAPDGVASTIKIFVNGGSGESNACLWSDSGSDSGDDSDSGSDSDSGAASDSGSDSGDDSDSGSDSDSPDGPVSPNVDPSNPPAGQPTDIMPSAAGVDWRLLGGVNPIQDQGQCGSCWAFGTTSQLEGMYFVKYGTLLKLSEQQLVDCANGDDYGNYGCNGGYPTNVFNYYLNDYKMMTEGDYPYKAVTGTCQYDSSKLTNVQTNQDGDWHQYTPDQIKDWVEKNGTMSIGVSASSRFFMNYSKGILNNTKCAGAIDHAVAIVGWGRTTDTGVDYWIVRNQWGTGWGDQGYIYMATQDKGPGICMSQHSVNTVTMR